MPSSKPTYLVIDTSTPTNPPSETEIYSVAKVAYSKLVTEASLKDQNLRRLVGHANLYDKLLDEYNNSFSDSESDIDNNDADPFSDSEIDSDIDSEIEEFATQAYAARNSSKDVSIHSDSTYIYQDQQQAGVRFEDVLIDEKEDALALLCKAPSHSEGLELHHVLGGYAEVEVKELEVFDE
ncbi:hypothetical protein BKA65DRAFT_501455 [Rhexocercosporidium sp. MPI-PUGE-AT-0058]|nr:hypothetical protein BKA65DRAFT_501455 [Rhexocercosporidium sp. MPI-PUGE-AT-0058]